MKELPKSYKKLFEAFMICEAEDYKKLIHPCEDEIRDFINKTRGCIRICSFSNTGENIRDIAFVLPDADGKFKSLNS